MNSMEEAFDRARYVGYAALAIAAFLLTGLLVDTGMVRPLEWLVDQQHWALELVRTGAVTHWIHVSFVGVFVASTVGLLLRLAAVFPRSARLFNAAKVFRALSVFLHAVLFGFLYHGLLANGFNEVMLVLLGLAGIVMFFIWPLCIMTFFDICDEDSPRWVSEPYLKWLWYYELGAAFTMAAMAVLHEYTPCWFLQSKDQCNFSDVLPFFPAGAVWLYLMASAFTLLGQFVPAPAGIGPRE